MPKPLTAPARLNLLLPWLTGAYDEHVVGPNPAFGHPVYGAGEGAEEIVTRTDYRAVRRALAAFVESFDGTAEAAHVAATPDDAAEALDDKAIGELEAKLNILLEQGFGELGARPSRVQYLAPDGTAQEFEAAGGIHDLALPISSLRVAVRSAGRRKPAKQDSVHGTHVIAGGVTALRNYRAPGAFVLRVQGPLFELVPYLVAALLTAPGMVAVKQCERPACEHFIVTATAKRGRPRQYCSDSCRELNKERLEQQVRKLAAEGRTNRSIADLLGISVKKVMSLRKSKEE